MRNFIFHRQIQINSKKRNLYVKTNSKLTHPKEYIKHKGEMITYKQYLKLKHIKKIFKGGQPGQSILRRGDLNKRLEMLAEQSRQTRHHDPIKTKVSQSLSPSDMLKKGYTTLFSEYTKEYISDHLKQERIKKESRKNQGR